MLVMIGTAGAAPEGPSSKHFLPQTLPPGFSYAKQPEFYGTSEHKSQDGSIFDYIDGGGIIYINHGFREVTHLVLQDPKKNSVTLDIYDMVNSNNAQAAFDDEMICPKGDVKINVGTQCKSYAYPPEYLLYFVKDKYLVSLAVSDDTLAETLRQFSTSLYQDLR